VEGRSEFGIELSFYPLCVLFFVAPREERESLISTEIGGDAFFLRAARHLLLSSLLPRLACSPRHLPRCLSCLLTPDFRIHGTPKLIIAMPLVAMCVLSALFRRWMRARRRRRAPPPLPSTLAVEPLVLPPPSPPPPLASLHYPVLMLTTNGAARPRRASSVSAGSALDAVESARFSWAGGMGGIGGVSSGVGSGSGGNNAGGSSGVGAVGSWVASATAGQVEQRFRGSPLLPSV